MFELRLGVLETDGGERLADVLGEPRIEVPPGRFDVVGRVDERSKRFEAGALTRNIGNDQWMVHLINARQLTRLAHSELLRMEGGVAESPRSLGTALAAESTVHIASHLLGLGAGLAAASTTLEISTAALGALAADHGTDVAARQIGEKLALEGVDPNSRASVHKALEQHQTATPFSLELER